jgi:hypothetical protein
MFGSLLATALINTPLSPAKSATLSGTRITIFDPVTKSELNSPI